MRAGKAINKKGGLSKILLGMKNSSGFYASFKKPRGRKVACPSNRAQPACEKPNFAMPSCAFVAFLNQDEGA